MARNTVHHAIAMDESQLWLSVELPYPRGSDSMTGRPKPPWKYIEMENWHDSQLQIPQRP